MRKLGALVWVDWMAFASALVYVSGCNAKPVYLQKATGSWQITVQTPECEFGHVILLPPEREGDVVTIYCNQMPVRGNAH